MTPSSATQPVRLHLRLPAQVLESEACGVAAAPIGLCNMLNAGGAVLAAELAGKMGCGRGRARCCGGPACQLCATKQPSSGSTLPSFRPAPSTLPSEEDTQRASLRLTVRGAGRFLAFASRRPAAVLLDGAPAEGVDWEEGRGALWFSVPWREDVGSGPRAAAIVFEAAA